MKRLAALPLLQLRALRDAHGVADRVLRVVRAQKVLGFVGAGAVATAFLVGGFCAWPL